MSKFKKSLSARSVHALSDASDDEGSSSQSNLAAICTALENHVPVNHKTNHTFSDSESSASDSIISPKIKTEHRKTQKEKGSSKSCYSGSKKIVKKTVSLQQKSKSMTHVSHDISDSGGESDSVISPKRIKFNNHVKTLPRKNLLVGKNASEDKKISRPHHMNKVYEEMAKIKATNGDDSNQMTKSTQFEVKYNPDFTEHKTGIYLTKVNGIHSKHNRCCLSLKDILSSRLGTLIKSVHFNYVFDVEWLVNQYPSSCKNLPMLLVHGFSRGDKKKIIAQAKPFPNISLFAAKLEVYGTHHSKMIFLHYKEGLRIIIMTANVIERDWDMKTQALWMSPLLLCGKSDSPTCFKQDLINYIEHYQSSELAEWIQIINDHDMSPIKVRLVSSVPGRHSGEKKFTYGHLHLKKLLTQHSVKTIPTNWPLIAQFSSIGSLGANPDSWLTSEFRSSVAVPNVAPKILLVYPSKDDVRQSLEGYQAGASLPYSINTAKRQPWLHKMMHRWQCDRTGRSHASPHIKTYVRCSPDGSSIAWFLMTSSNLSKAAWGSLEKSSSQLHIRSYELGVLLMPSDYELDVFSGDDEATHIPLPYDLPLIPYKGGDKPWIWDIPYTDMPDTHGNKWCPPL